MSLAGGTPPEENKLPLHKTKNLAPETKKGMCGIGTHDLPANSIQADIGQVASSRYRHTCICRSGFGLWAYASDPHLQTEQPSISPRVV